MKLWIDDVRPAPVGWTHITNVNDAKECISEFMYEITHISLDHDAGDFVHMGGDYIKLLDWIEEKSYTDDWDFSHIVFSFHSANPIGVANMRRICKKLNLIVIDEV